MSRSEFRAALVAAAPEFDLDLPAETIERFAVHYELLVTWNRRMNLTRITAPGEAARYHFLESAFLSRILASAPAHIVDVGSGSGFPGLPLACLYPRTSTVLIEPLVKRAVFLKEAVRALELEHVEVRNQSFASSDVGTHSLLVARALDRFRALLPALLGSSSGVVALFSEPDLLQDAAQLAVDRTAEVFALAGTDRRRIGLFTRSFHVEQRNSERSIRST